MKLDRDTQIKEFTELIEKNQGIAHKVSRMYCNGTICSEDLFQDILLQLWRSYPNYNNKRKFSTWMYRIALNTAISQFRKTKSNKIDFIDSYSEIISYNDNIDERNEDASLLFNAISQLSKAEKAIIMLYMDDCSYEEISEIIGISVSNVGVKINRIKKKLREYLKDLGYEL